MRFSFFSKRLEGKEIDLIPKFVSRPNESNQFVSSYYYDIALHGTYIMVGHCDLRVGMNEELYYLGQIGYGIDENYRGHGYAYQACRLLFNEAAQKHGMSELIITCNPDNIPSRKTLEKLKGELIEIAPVPKNHYCYKIGEYEKCIFRYKL